MAGLYWGEQGPPRETAWRDVRAHPPPPVAGAKPVCQRLQQLQAAAASRQQAPWAPEVEARPPPVAWEGAAGGDARLRKAVPLLRSNWSLVATHVPGRSGHECRERWRSLQMNEDAANGVGATMCVARLETCHEHDRS